MEQLAVPGCEQWLACLLVYVEMSGISSQSSWWVDRLWSSLLYRVTNSCLTAYWCRWRCLLDLQRAASELTGCGAAFCTGFQTVAWLLTSVGGDVW